MPWWGWVLIVVGVLALGGLKLFVFNKIKAKRKKTEHLDHSKED